MAPASVAWLDEVLARIAAVYSDQFLLEPAGVEEVEHERHGKCLCCTYRFVFHEGVPQRLPTGEGPIITRMIQRAAPPNTLVPTRSGGKPDFGDWGWVADGVAEMWIFLREKTQ